MIFLCLAQLAPRARIKPQVLKDNFCSPIDVT